MESNKITDISALSRLTNLKSLSLYNNKIRNLQALSTLINLDNLNLYINKVENIEPLGKLTNLTDLSLGMNKISDIGSLKNLTKLTTIKNIKGLGTLTGLEALTLSHNQIIDISGLSSLSKLNRLFVDNNKIDNLKGFDKLENLRSLDISQNKITDISLLRGLKNLSLTNIYLEGNPLPEYVFKDKLNQQFILSMLSPYIDEDVKNYYGEFRQYMNAGILDIEQIDRGYRLKIRIETFVGPHNPPYGIDTLTITKNNSEIKVEEFKHENVSEN
ncbi:leucine-rich repeat domain-containing protein [Clostridium aciditolerans]|uniref:Leucine-rich repeat domain-containing protein n=1 Tax=Clostridium aciditolerans TaxID=339861 RepID=A0A934LZM5_9CLOT|nr:leucine-rich repeat domain-containing protein [Clostridium aciditolerans]MBI6871139.1 leucine-rich repeat domain-containing protein [Clostridium aciditolerans]